MLYNKIRAFVESNIFGVCTKLGEKMGVSIESIRLFFIYSSLLTLGSPVIIYLSLAFLIRIREHIRKFRGVGEEFIEGQ